MSHDLTDHDTDQDSAENGFSQGGLASAIDAVNYSGYELDYEASANVFFSRFEEAALMTIQHPDHMSESMNCDDSSACMFVRCEEDDDGIDYTEVLRLLRESSTPSLQAGASTPVSPRLQHQHMSASQTTGRVPPTSSSSPRREGAAAAAAAGASQPVCPQPHSFAAAATSQSQAYANAHAWGAPLVPAGSRQFTTYSPAPSPGPLAAASSSQTAHAPSSQPQPLVRSVSFPRESPLLNPFSPRSPAFSLSSRLSLTCFDSENDYSTDDDKDYETGSALPSVLEKKFASSSTSTSMETQGPPGGCGGLAECIA